MSINHHSKSVKDDLTYGEEWSFASNCEERIRVQANTVCVNHYSRPVRTKRDKGDGEILREKKERLEILVKNCVIATPTTID